MISILEKSVADKIAAGEVIDRPLSIVKELVENAIDAKASVISVEIEKGGKTYIRVTDNGEGIPAEEAEVAFLRHATSKIITADDLTSIRTLGFRGEALASITAVTRTEIVTKTSNEKMGVKLAIDGSQIMEKTPAGCPEGTTIIVRDLFYNTPARLKFLKSDGVECGLIIEFVSQIALAYPDLKIRMINNGTMLFSTQGKGDLYQAILTIYDKEIGGNLISVKAEEGYLRLEGYVSNPGYSKVNRKHQVFFVNGRIVNSKVIETGIKEAYIDKLFDGRHPIALLFVHADQEKLDVNIHPNKREVRFDDEKLISAFIRRAIRRALLSKEAIPKMEKSPPEKQKQIEITNLTEKSNPTTSENQVDIKKLLSEIRIEEDTKANILKESAPTYTAPPIKETEQESEKNQAPEQLKTPPAFDFDQLSLIGSIFGTYILASDNTCFYLIDQHAAHERIFFEKLLSQYKSSEKQRQTIMIPITIQVALAIKENQYDWMDALNTMGFSIEEFGPKTYIIKEIPMFMGLQEAEQFVHDYLDQVSDNVELENLPVIEKIISRSCKNAVKAHDYLAEQEIKHLIDNLKHCENPFSCPHGRPTFVKINQHEIEKMFKRV